MYKKLNKLNLEKRPSKKKQKEILRPNHTERKQKAKFSLIFVNYSLVFLPVFRVFFTFAWRD